jgi:hypothetical protein
MRVSLFVVLALGQVAVLYAIVVAGAAVLHALGGLLGGWDIGRMERARAEYERSMAP